MTEPTISTAAANGELVNRVQKLRLGEQLANPDKGTRSSIAWLPWTLCILLAFAWAGYGIRGYRNVPSANATFVETPTKASEKPSTTTTPLNQPPVVAGTLVHESKGNLIPARQVAVSPIDVAGRIVELNIVEGRKYKAGDVLARIEDVSYKAQVEEAAASVAAAQRRLEASQARLDMVMPESVRKIELNQVQQELKEAESARSRSQDEVDRLAKLGIGSAAERELNQAKFDLQGTVARVLKLEATLEILKDGPRKEQKKALEADIKGADADVKVAQARFAQAKWRLDNCTITAPMTGTVLTKKAELYNLVNPLAFAATSGSVCDMADLSDLEVELEIAERDIQKIANVVNCRIRSDAFPDKVYAGKLDRIYPIANRSAGTIKVRVKVILPEGEEPGTILKPEMGAIVTFLSGK